MSIKSVLSAITRQLTRHDKSIADISRNVVHAPFAAGKASLQTIAAGVISVTRPHVVVLPESGTADNLDTINNFADGKFIVISTVDVGDTITVRDESVSGGNIALRGVTSRVLSDPEDSLLLIYKESVGFWIQAGGTPGGGVPALHASTHQHGGTDEVAVAAPAANAIPKAGGSGTLALGWIPAGTTPVAHAASHQNNGSDELAHQTLDGAGSNTHAAIDTHIADAANPHVVTKTQVGLGNVTNDAQIPLAQKGAANGVAELDASSRLPVAQLPISVMEYKGTWDASTNTPTLADGTGSAGDVYRVSVAGTQNLGSGAITFGVGDYIIYNGSTWEKSDTTDSVVSVNGATGVVVLTTDNIAEGTAPDRNYITDAEQTKLAGIEALADVTDLTNVGAAIVAASDGGAPVDTDEFAINRAGTLTTILLSGIKTAFNAIFARLGAANIFTENQNIESVATSGSSLRVFRNLALGSTDAPVVKIIQAINTDDQPALEVQQVSNLAAAIEVAQPLNGVLRIRVNNSSAAVGAYASYQMINDAGVISGFFQNGSGNAAYAGINSLNLIQSGNQRLAFGTNNLVRLVIEAVGDIIIGATTTALARLHIVQPTLGSIVQRLQSTATNDDPIQDFLQGRIATTDATATTLFTMPIAANTIHFLESYVVARRTGGSAGAADDCAIYHIRGVCRQVAGASVIVSNLATVIAEDQAAWDATFDVTGTDARIRVTGAANNNITWHCHVLHRLVST